ncbi:hypothetical protein BBW65_06865 [Helicobacter enhydrae]|uniref:Uncharacterized protein n=1 Tax=Helicobacter enhydrae TaxID=222136 RepID=A0A1B1U754_9HELI|nr:hypothetical protein [Helicobacter enhydrae]ANV98532.1 hypothetical protein BBW65_06865 [Helicobacter enhydrae]
MSEVKFWIIPFVCFSCFCVLMLALMIYVYSDQNSAGAIDRLFFAPNADTNGVATMQEFQQAMDKKFK